MTNHTLRADAIEDAEVARIDAELLTAGIIELVELAEADRLTAYAVSDVARDVLPRLTALRAWLLEQVLEVTA